jgi:hypothetical protein
LISQFDLMSEQHGFVTLDAREQPSDIQRKLRRMVGDYLHTTNYQSPTALPDL